MYRIIKDFSYYDSNKIMQKVKIGDVINSNDIPNFDFYNQKYKFAKPLT